MLFKSIHDKDKIDKKFIKIVNNPELPDGLLLWTEIDLHWFGLVEKHLKEKYPDHELIDFYLPNASDGPLEMITNYACFYLLDKTYYNSPIVDGYKGKDEAPFNGNIDSTNIEEYKG